MSELSVTKPHSHKCGGCFYSFSRFPPSVPPPPSVRKYSRFEPRTISQPRGAPICLEFFSHAVRPSHQQSHSQAITRNFDQSFFFAACTNPHIYKLGILSILSTSAMTKFLQERKRYIPNIVSPSFYFVLSYFARPTLLPPQLVPACPTVGRDISPFYTIA